MGTYEDADVATSHLNRPQSEKPALGFSSSGLHSPSEETFIDNFRDVGLHSYGDIDKGEHGGPVCTTVFPLRPYAGDCPHYLKTGICKFGHTCKFNHPVRRTGQVVKERDQGSEKSGHVECKYYLTAGGCKFGKFCRYSHSKDDSDKAAPVLNFIGLPIRVGEKECLYYMRNGSCGYGAQCVFHHPEPSSIGELDSYKLSLNDKSSRQSGYSLGSLDCESALLHLSEVSKSHEAPWSSHPLSNSTFSYQDDNSYNTTANPIPQETHRRSELNQCQAPEFPHQRSRHAHLTPGTNRADMLQPIISMKVEEFPARPGQPECAYFVKTGYCKFKSSCRFHHPKGQLTCLLSEKGLPLRPARSICRQYEHFGTCKFGLACLFDHPINHNLSTVQDWSSSEPPSGHDAGYWSE